MPDDWETTSERTEGTTEPFCEAGVAVFEPLPIAVELEEVGYQRTSLGPYVLQLVTRFATEADASAYIDATRQQVEACPEYVEDGDTFRWLALDLETYGDETYLAQVQMVGLIAGQVVYERVGSTVSLIFHYSLGQPVSGDETLRLLELTHARLLG